MPSGALIFLIRAYEVVSELLIERNQIKQLLEANIEVESINTKLIEHITKNTIGLNSEMKLAVAQCVLKSTANEGSKHFDVYKSWIQAIRGGKIR